MKWLFWLSVLFIGYTYAGYPLWLYVRSRWRALPVRSAPIVPSVSIVMAVHNEAEVLPRKLRNLSEIDYPPDRCEIIFVSDGSTDGTNQVLGEAGALPSLRSGLALMGAQLVAAPFSDETPGVATRAAPTKLRWRVLTLPQHRGKASALNCGIQEAKGSIVVFTDARQLIAPDAVRRLVANFSDRSVGCVSGELMLAEIETPEGVKKTAASPQHAGGGGRVRFSRDASVNGVGAYWSMEKKIRQWESATGSVVGATGALYAVRRELLVPVPVGTILDDVYLPLHVIRQGKRAVFEPRARAYDN